MSDDARTVRNALLRNMSAENFALVAPHLQYKPLLPRQSIERAGKPIANLYFLETGLCSVTTTSPLGKELEIGMIGAEGLTGAAVIMGGHQSPFSSYMQIEGGGYEIKADDLTLAMEASRALHAMLLQYAHGLSVQVVSTAIANSQASVMARLARWLLMVDDRMVGSEFPMTHDLLAIMLGGRRPWISEMLNTLEGLGAVKATRGHIAIKDRSALIEAAKGFYGEAEEEYRRLLRSTLALPDSNQTPRRIRNP